MHWGVTVAGEAPEREGFGTHRLWLPQALAAASLLLLCIFGSYGAQGEAWPADPCPHGDLDPGSTVMLALGTVPPEVPVGSNVSIEVDGPDGQVLLVHSFRVDGTGDDVTFGFRLNDRCAHGTYQVSVCHLRANGTVELIQSTFNVSMQASPAPPAPRLLLMLGFALGATLALVAGVHAAGEPSKYRMLALLTPLFTRLREDQALTNRIRWQILGYITDNPGSNYNQIRKELNLSNGTLSYHLRVLERMQKVQAVRDGRLLRFYTEAMTIRDPLPRTFTEMEGRIIETIVDNPGISQKEIALILHVKPDNVGYHLRKMTRENILQATSHGRETRYKVVGRTKPDAMPTAPSERR